MSSPDIQALPELQGLPVLIDRDGIVVLDDLSKWATRAERAVHDRARINAIAFAGMSSEELHLFFARASQAAVKSWNAQQSFFGKIHNVMTTRNPGYAEVPGRILSQCLKALGEEAESTVSQANTYLLRADVAADFRNQLQAQVEAAA